MTSDAADAEMNRRQALSALMDGEARDDEVARACESWGREASLRSSWHAYQMVGDVLRSEDLASTVARDAAFLAALRARLADEPVVLSPQPLARPASVPAALPARAVSGLRRRWIAPSAVAAGFVAVAGAVFVTRGPAPSGVPAATLATGNGPSGGAAALVADGRAASAVHGVPVANGAMIRDARLDRYLNAHKQFAGSSVLGVPSGFMRNAVADVDAGGR